MHWAEPEGGPGIVICPPATLIAAAAQICAGSPIAIGGAGLPSRKTRVLTRAISRQTCCATPGASYVIVGHSERRRDHGESDVLVSAKAEAALRAGLKVILCVGETEAERAAGRALDVVARQLEGSLPSAPHGDDLVVAYEPVLGDRHRRDADAERCRRDAQLFASKTGGAAAGK